jgi:hypothetical protein
MKSKCDNCGWIGDPAVSLGNVADLGDRLDPGQEVPSGECDECGCLCYNVKKVERKNLCFEILRNNPTLVVRSARDNAQIRALIHYSPGSKTWYAEGRSRLGSRSLREIADKLDELHDKQKA